MRKKELSIKIDYISIVFENMNADKLIRRLLQLPLEYFQVQNAKIKHKDYTRLYQFGTIKVYGDRQMKDGTSETGCYLILSGQGCDDYNSFLRASNSTYNDFFNYYVHIKGKDEYTDYGYSDDIKSGFGYNGEEQDETGLIYLRARYYNPVIGQFIQLDEN